MLFAGSLSFFLTLIFYCRATVLINDDGIGRSCSLLRFIKDGRVVTGPICANALYYPLNSFIWEVLHLSPGQMHLQLAIENAFFGALAIVAVYYIIMLLHGNRTVAVLTAVFQASCGFFLGMCTSCNDIIPAYSCSIWSLYFFFKYLKRPDDFFLLVKSGTLYAAALLLHWTIALPLAPAIGLGILITEAPVVFKQKAAAVYILVVLLVLNIVANEINTTLADIIFPGKGVNTLWTGWSADKMLVELVNSVSFLAPALVIKNPRLILGSAVGAEQRGLHLYQYHFFALLTIAILVYAAIAILRNKGFHLKVFSVLLVLYVFGSLMASYDQGYDPQFIIQPMFILVVAVSFVFLSIVQIKRIGPFFRLAMCIIPILAILRITVYYTNFYQFRVDDERIERVQAIFDRVRSVKKTLFVIALGNRFFQWGRYLAPGNEINYALLPTEKMAFLEPGNKHLVYEYDSIFTSYSKPGYEIVIDSVCFSCPEKLAYSFGGYDLSANLIDIGDYIKKNYAISETISFPGKTYYKIKRRSAATIAQEGEVAENNTGEAPAPLLSAK